MCLVDTFICTTNSGQYLVDAFEVRRAAAAIVGGFEGNRPREHAIHLFSRGIECNESNYVVAASGEADAAAAGANARLAATAGLKGSGVFSHDSRRFVGRSSHVLILGVDLVLHWSGFVEGVILVSQKAGCAHRNSVARVEDPFQLFHGAVGW